MLTKALSCPKSNKSPNLVTLKKTKAHPNLVIVLHQLCRLLWHFINSKLGCYCFISHNVGQYKPSSPSAKELHGYIVEWEFEGVWPSPYLLLLCCKDKEPNNNNLLHPVFRFDVGMIFVIVNVVADSDHKQNIFPSSLALSIEFQDYKN